MTPSAGGRPQPTGPTLLLDGMSLAFRAYFALPDDLATSEGVVTNAVHGFASMVVYLLREHRPGGLAVAFDLAAPTFRDEILSDYKAGRAATPDDLFPQFDMIRELLAALAVPVLEVEGFEADDVLATMATRWRDRGDDVIVVTGDRDCFQLVEDPHIRVLYNRRGVSDYSLYDAAGIVERTGVTPDRYPLLAALRGDPSDNLPGVPGVGEKTAAKLINSYGDLEALFSHLDELSPKLRANLVEHEERVRLNAEVIPLRRDVDVEVAEAEVALGGWDVGEIEARATAFELRTIWSRLVPLLRDGTLGEPRPGSTPIPGGDEVDGRGRGGVGTGRASGGGAAGADGVTGSAAEGGVEVSVELLRPDDPGEVAADLGQLISDADGAEGQSLVAVAGRWEGGAGRSALRGLAVVTACTLGAGSTHRGVWIADELLGDDQVGRVLASVLGPGPHGQRLVGHEVKELWRSLLPLGIDARGLDMDSSVAAYLLDPSSGQYGLSAVATDRGLGQHLEEGGASGQLALGEPAEDSAMSSALDAATVAVLAPRLRRELAAEGLEALHDDVETPLVRVLARMEVTGIGVDRDELAGIGDELARECSSLEARVHELAGHEFNVNSTPQLRTVLYDELGLTPGRKTKTGYSTDAATLESLRDDHPVVATLLGYREVEKLRSTYGSGLLAEVAEDGRIHASFRQTVARTGRLSSERPNLHNIPVRTELGRRFRRAFVPRAGCTMLVADYDQIELRVLAHLADDPGLRQAFAEGSDVHRTVAAGVYRVPLEEVTSTQRERAKMVSYGLAYGMEAYGLSRRLSTGVDEASEIIDRYFEAFPKVRRYMDNTVREAREAGETRTELGRKRPLPELSDRNYRVRQAAERQAMNAGIQGLAADIFKTALVRLDTVLEELGTAAQLVLQVHDEVLVEVPLGEEDQVGPLTERALVDAAELSVPLEVSMGWGPSWAAAKGG